MSNVPVIAQKEPYALNLEAGKKYYWCACGLSKKQPLCDGSHKGTGINPLEYQATQSGEAWLCGCKQTRDQPFCDGSHNAL